MQKYNLFYNEAELSVIIYDKNQLIDLRSKQKIIFEDNHDLDIRMRLFLEKHLSFFLYCQENHTEEVLHYLKSFFKCVQAAGGIVFNHKNELLTIKRFGFYDFPKGHIEQGEDALKAAMREVWEETNVGELEVVEPLETTYHVFVDIDGYVLKETQWFRMKTSAVDKLIPQNEENITGVWWMSSKEIQQIIRSFYPSLQQLINKIII